MAEITAAAPAKIRAVRLLPVNRRRVDLRYLAESGVLERLHDENVAVLTPDGAVDKRHLPVYPGNAQSLGGIPLNDGTDGLIFSQRFHMLLLAASSLTSARPFYGMQQGRKLFAGKPEVSLQCFKIRTFP